MNGDLATLSLGVICLALGGLACLSAARRENQTLREWWDNLR